MHSDPPITHQNLLADNSELRRPRIGGGHSIRSLVKDLKYTAFGGRALGEALSVLDSMRHDANCSTILTISGAMSVAQQGGLIAELIEHKVVKALVTTGAVVTHELVEALGLKHYRAGSASDEEYAALGMNRIYDSLESDSNLNAAHEYIAKVVRRMPLARWTSSNLMRETGLSLLKDGCLNSFITAAYMHDIPIFIPALTDSEIGLAVLCLDGSANEGAEAGGSKADLYAPYDDVREYARLVASFTKPGIITIGGGVPRNWAQQVIPYLMDTSGVDRRFYYGVRICPDSDAWGGLSGSTFSEAVSWRKCIPRSEGGKFAEVICDATIAFPILACSLVSRTVI